MKKSLVIVVVLLAAVVTKAASISWTVSPLTLSDPDGGNLSGAAIYLLVGDSSSVAASIEAGSFLTDYSSSIVASTTTHPGGGVAAYSATGLDTGTLNFYVVVFDESTASGSANYIVSSTLSATTYTPPETGTEVIFGSSNFGDWTAVPEPTSMALLVLGITAMGLRRKFHK